MQRISGRKADILAWTDPAQIESVALEQLKNISGLPWVFHHVAAMPDVHFGKGATVGSVIAMKGAVSPAAVGVDIGCGVGAVRTSLTAKDLPDDLRSVRHALERAIPVGFNEHREPIDRPQDKGLWDEFRHLTPAVQNLLGKARSSSAPSAAATTSSSCASTSGSRLDDAPLGSRNIGKTLADVHISRAKKLAHNQDLPDRDLAVFLSGTPEMDEYRRDLFWAQRYAMKNRETMLDLYGSVLRQFWPQVQLAEPVLCHHNYVAEETHFGKRCWSRARARSGRGAATWAWCRAAWEHAATSSEGWAIRRASRALPTERAAR